MAENEIIEPTETEPGAEAPTEEPAPTGPVKFCFISLGEQKYQVYKDEGETAPMPAGAEGPMAPEAAGAETHETIDGLENALKEILRLVKAHPAGGDIEEHFQAGHKTEAAKMGYL